MQCVFRIAVLMAAATSLTLPAAHAASPAPGVAERLSTSQTAIGTLLDNPATKAVLLKYIPQLAASAQIEMARSLTLKALQGYAGEMLTDDTLSKIDADLAKLPIKR